MRRLLLLFSALSLCAFAQANPEWHREFPAFRIAGNLYYVGTADLAIYLVHTSAGNILINSNFEEDIPALRKSITSLGFHYSDTKILLISHAHSDHDAATGVIAKETGAKLEVMSEDVAEENRHAHVDRVLHDGDTVELGGSKWVAHRTPGHTPGCTTWTSVLDDNGRRLNAVIIGSPNVNAGYFLVGNKKYPKIADDYVKTFAVLKSLPCDVFLGAHGAYFGMKEKYKAFEAGNKDAFIDPAGYRKFVEDKNQEFRSEWERQKAHPGTPKS